MDPDKSTSASEPQARALNEAEIRARLRRHGLRATPARCTLLSHLLRTTCHPTVETIIQDLERSGEDLPTATVYQNLCLLAEKGVLARFLDTGGLARFDADTRSHAHLVCTSCGRVDDIDEPAALPDRESARCAQDLASTWRLDPARVHRFGLCPDCASLR